MLVKIARTPDEISSKLTEQYGGTITRARKRARRNPWDGRGSVPSDARLLLDPYREGRLYSVLFTYDVGAHACGWLRNSDYDSCWHLSCCVLEENNISEAGLEEVQGMARAFFLQDYRFGWIEPPAGPTDPYRYAPSSRYVHHIRVFTDRSGNTIYPKGEVYDLLPWPDGSSPDKVFR